MSKLQSLEPSKVFHFFEEISNIPRTSGNEEAISQYLMSFAKERGLEACQDKSLNVIIKKGGTEGYEDSYAVIIQGHMDMAGEKSSESTHDFSKDPIELRIIGDYIYGTDTTLGADNGIAVAYALALLDSDDIAHPPLEVIITTGEEIGLKGASALELSTSKAKFLINLDGQREGSFLLSCAGGVTAKTSFSIDLEEYSGEAYEIILSNLKGGHSGHKINRQRANALKLMGRILHRLSKEMEIRIASLSGGARHNSIAREARAIVTIHPDFSRKMQEMLNSMMVDFKNEYAVEDSEIQLEIKITEAKRIISKEASERIIDYMVSVPDGVQSMSRDIDNLVTSSLNLGKVEELDNKIIFTHLIRSSIKSLKEYIQERISIISKHCGGSVEFSDDYPEWQYEANSKIRQVAMEAYKKLWGTEAKLDAVHAGVECGVLKEKLPMTDMISIGPDIHDAHTPSEHMSISSVERTWQLLKAVLSNLKNC